MAAIPFATFSVHHFVSSVGADAGFAAFVAVAILVLLYFAHARETATLRTRADEADMRIQELEGELAELSEQMAAIPAEISVRAASPRAAAAYGSAAPVAAVAAAAGPGSGLPPAAPAGVGAPSLAAATRLIPDPIGALPEYEPATAAGNGNGSARPVVAASAATAQRPVPAPAGGTARPVGAPPRAGAGGGGRPGGVPGAGQGRPPRPGQPRQGSQARPPGAPLRPPPRRSRGRMVLGGVIAALAVAAIVVGVIVLTGGKSGSSAGKTSSSANAALVGHRTASAANAVKPATVTVSVFNGTDVQHLGRSVSDRLTADGYHKGSVANASIQQQASTIVAYMAPADRADAMAVAKSLKLSSAAVRLVDPATKATVCPSAQTCTTTVVVTVGQDLAQQ
jgi:LytR cell envelope-related transcriptional attenuator